MEATNLVSEALTSFGYWLRSVHTEQRATELAGVQIRVLLVGKRKECGNLSQCVQICVILSKWRSHEREVRYGSELQCQHFGAGHEGMRHCRGSRRRELKWTIEPKVSENVDAVSDNWLLINLNQMHSLHGWTNIFKYSLGLNWSIHGAPLVFEQQCRKQLNRR